MKYSSVSVYSSSTSFFLVFTKIFLCSLTNNVISRVACLVGRLLCSDLLPLPSPNGLSLSWNIHPFRCRFSALQSHLSVHSCHAEMQKWWVSLQFLHFVLTKKNVYSNQQRYFARCLVGRLLCSDFCSLPSPNWLSLSWNIHPFCCHFSALQLHLSLQFLRFVLPYFYIKIFV